MTEPEVKDLLKQYLICKRFIDTQAYEKEYCNLNDVQGFDEKTTYEAKMNAIESFMQLLAPSDEYTLLRLHYIRGVPIEKCAFLMYISRRTAFRMLKKAHLSLCDFMNKKGADDEQRKAD